MKTIIAVLSFAAFLAFQGMGASSVASDALQSRAAVIEAATR